MCINPFGDHVLTCHHHTGSIRGHNHLMDVVSSLSHESKTGPVRVNHKVSTTGDGTRNQGGVEISNFSISLWDCLVIDVSFVCEFKGRNRAPGGWNNSVSHSNDILQVRTKVKNNKYKDVYGLVGSAGSQDPPFTLIHKAFTPVIVDMSGQIHADFLRLLWVLTDKQLWSHHHNMGKEDKIGNEAFRWVRVENFN